jgi:hypothetical protein
MAGGAARGEESAAWRKAESAETRFWQNRAPSASVYVYTTHLYSSRDILEGIKGEKRQNDILISGNYILKKIY